MADDGIEMHAAQWAVFLGLVIVILQIVTIVLILRG